MSILLNENGDRVDDDDEGFEVEGFSTDTYGLDDEGCTLLYLNLDQLAALRNVLYDCRDVPEIDQIWQQINLAEDSEDDE